MVFGNVPFKALHNDNSLQSNDYNLDFGTTQNLSEDFKNLIS
jgi:hypothetical protein